MKKLITILFFVTAIFSKELQYNVEFENLESGDTINVDLHLHYPLDSILNVVNGNIAGDNFSDTASFKQRMIDSVYYTVNDWIYAYTKKWQVWSSNTWAARFPRGAYFYINDTTANDQDFRIYIDSTKLVFLVNDDSTWVQNAVIDTAQIDTAHITYQNSTRVTVDSISVTNLDINGDIIFDSSVSFEGNLLSKQADGNYLGRTHITENHWSINETTIGSVWKSRATSLVWVDMTMSSDGKYQSAVAHNAKIWISDDYGVTWDTVATSLSWRGITMSSDGKYQSACATSGNIWISDDYGATWSSVASSLEWRDISMSSDGRYQSACIDGPGNIWISDDYGVTWSSVASSLEWENITVSSDGRYQSACIDGPGKIWISDDYGVTWDTVATSLSWRGITMSSDGKYQSACATSGNIWISDDYGATWSSVASSHNWTSIVMSSDGKYQSACDGAPGYIWISSDYGATWDSVAISLVWVDMTMSSDGKYLSAVASSNQIYTSISNSITRGTVEIDTAIVNAIRGNPDIDSLDVGIIDADSIGAFKLKGKITAGAIEIEGSNFDINGGTFDGGTIGGTAPGDATVNFLKIVVTTDTLVSNVATTSTGELIIDTEGEAALDTIETITGIDAPGNIFLMISTANDGRDVLLLDAGTLSLDGNCTLTHRWDTILLYGNVNLWTEVSRSDNE